MIVYDVGNEQSYANLERWRNSFKNATQVESVPFVLLGNKSDTVGRVPQARVTKEWVETNNCNSHFLTSALTYQNVEEAFQQVATHALEFQMLNRKGESLAVVPGGINFSKQNGRLVLNQETPEAPKSKSYCC